MIGYPSRVAATSGVSLFIAVVAGVSLARAAPDHTPPTAPVLSVTDIGATHVQLSWTPSVEDGPFIGYQVFANGNPIVWAGANTSAAVLGLNPTTTHLFTVRARDNGINWSPPSNEVPVTTLAPDPNDTTAPTIPGDLVGFDGGCGEAWLSWDESTDDADPQFALRYEIHVNGVLRPESRVFGRDATVAYASVVGSNTFDVVAVDSAGNASEPGSLTLQMSQLCQ